MSSCKDLNLFNSWSLEPQVETVIAQASYLRMTFIIADADHWNLCLFDQLYQLLTIKATVNILHHNYNITCN